LIENKTADNKKHKGCAYLKRKGKDWEMVILDMAVVGLLSWQLSWKYVDKVVQEGPVWQQSGYVKTATSFKSMIEFQ
jgi:hypothetical protein